MCLFRGSWNNEYETNLYGDTQLVLITHIRPDINLGAALWTQTTTWPDTWDENQPHISSSVCIIYIAVLISFLVRVKYIDSICFLAGLPSV